MKGKISLVSGDPNEIGALSALLAEEGYKVDVARSGESALGVIAQAMPEVIVSVDPDS